MYDESQDVAKAYKAACTPEFYLADADLKLFYHGQFDGSRPKSDTPVTGESPLLQIYPFHAMLLFVASKKNHIRLLVFISSSVSAFRSLTTERLY